MDDSRRKRISRARERQATRYRRRDTLHTVSSTLGEVLPPVTGRFGQAASRLRDVGWHLLYRTSLLRWAAGMGALLLTLTVLVHLFSGRIFPNVWALGTHVGNLTVEEAESALRDVWRDRVKITLYVENRASVSVSPADLGLLLDAAQTAQAARAAGLAGIPFGIGVTPVVSVQYQTAQNFLLNLTNQVAVEPQNASYVWQNDQLTGVPGQTGRALDVMQTLARVQQDPAGIVQRGRLDVQMVPLIPDMMDPSLYLDQVRDITTRQITLTGYDPFTDTTMQWTTTRDEVTRWLEATPTGLSVRQSAVLPFIEGLNTTLNSGGGAVRYVEPGETIDLLRAAMQSSQTAIVLRIRYRPTTYTVEAGDTGFRISRKTGIPFYLLQEYNPGMDWNILSIGQVISLPTRDVTITQLPLPNKRIVVDLNAQTLYAFENGQLVFQWLISSGVDDAPTSPGIYQILSRSDVAYGSSYTLCGERDCGQWTMYWFMGVYEVIPGLMNGFHGAVLLPGGAYLGGGNVGYPYTFGCIMSENSNAERLYQWADVGTIVEIISDEFAPQSALAQRVASGAFGAPTG